MSTLVTTLYEALIEAGATKEKARQTADAVSDSFEQFARKEDNDIAKKHDIYALKAELQTEIHELRTEIAGMKAEMRSMKWTMNGVGFILVVYVLQQMIG